MLARCESGIGIFVKTVEKTAAQYSVRHKDDNRPLHCALHLDPAKAQAAVTTILESEGELSHIALQLAPH